MKLSDPFSYTNRQGKTHYVKMVSTGKGGVRYYLTQDPNSNDLIESIPDGFEVVEYPYDGRVVVRKAIPIKTTQEERAIVQSAMDNFSPVKDFLITAEDTSISIHISQFSHYFDGLYPTAEEVQQSYGDSIHLWKQYDWIMTFALIDPQKRKFQVIRKASFRYDAVPIGEGTDLKALAEKYCYHVGRASLLDFWIPGEEE
ncbi:MAG TPA: hypothetical protein PKA00_06210 [Saprospiraceae bacterium]|nr:hypothetical protein [Saprospiraceae bacterium]HMQ82478.1 hypothetical protein [Saprospiraceae bacterium]